MILKVVIDKTTKQVKRYGYCDFENDGGFDSNTEEIIEKDFIFDSCINVQDWQYDSQQDTFVQI